MPQLEDCKRELLAMFSSGLEHRQGSLEISAGHLQQQWQDSMTKLAIKQNPTDGFAARPLRRVKFRREIPLSWGAHQHGDGVNFVVFSRHATPIS